MDVTFLLRGLLVGFSIAAPIGPVGVRCIRRTLLHDRKTGFVSGLGAATADALFGSIAGMALILASSYMTGQQVWLGILGGAFLVYLGAKIFLSPPARPVITGHLPTRRGAAWSGYLAAYTTTLVQSLTNPLGVLTFVAIFAGLGLANDGQGSSALGLVAGIFLGSALWWLLLSTIVNLFQTRLFQPEALHWVNRISGLVMVGFGLLALLGLD